MPSPAMELPKGPLPSNPQHAPESLGRVGMLDLVKCDPRPTFILDTTLTAEGSSTTPVYWNAALASLDSQKLLKRLVGNVSQDDDQVDVPDDFFRFKRWIASSQKPPDKPFNYYDYSWMHVSVASRWSIISGMSIDVATSACLPDSIVTSDDALLKVPSKSKASTFDWTWDPPPTRISPHVKWARSIDWASTSLGPLTGWSAQLRSTANLVMQDPRPAVLFWSPDLTMIYNESYIKLLGGLHPCMGKSARDALAGVWSEYFEPFIELNLAGKTVEKNNTSVHIERNGFMEETYFSLKFIPIFDSDGATIGHYEPLVETTREVIAERRAQTLLQLSEEVPRARSSDSYWALATQVLSQNAIDIPFSLLYSVEANCGSDSSSNMTRYSDNHQDCTLRGSFGIPEGCAAAPARLDLQQDQGFSPYFRQAMLARNPIAVHFDKGSQAADLMRGISCQGFGDPCRAAAICPINPTSSRDNILGYMVIGLNPRRPYDEDYRQFIMVASRLLSTSLTSILLHEEDIHRRERAIANAESMRIELKHQLLAIQKEVERSALKFQRFAERADIGIFIVDMKGVYSYRNDAWFHILSPADRNIELAEAWGSIIDDEYVELGQAKFKVLAETKQHQSFELRLKRTWTVPSHDSDDPGSEQPMWILLSIFCELKDDGDVLEIVGCFSDISRQKWGEKLQATQAVNARESKRQLENFIDTTSHEMRNPLSAIVQSADSIISAHKDFQRTKDYQAIYQSVLDSTVDAAETIVQCSKHMKTIVDDVLTMSKMDSGLFVMTPVDVQLQSVAGDAVRMFEGEARAAGIELQFCLEDSCKQTSVDYVSLDPTRVLQVLINLITNAIKFTRLEDKRHICVSLGMSTEQPARNADGRVQFLQTPEAEEAPTLKADWEKGGVVYIIFSVQDTGRGLSDAEHDLLFGRFSQASPRTHIDYGGSGLGLFIARKLTEMHGGAIGFASKAKVGSTFSFYIKCRKSRKMARSSSSTSATNLTLRTQAYVMSNRSRDEADKPPSLGRKYSEDRTAASGLDILVVEDNLVNQRVLAKQLRNIGMKVTVANHGGEALDYLRTTSYCIKESEDAPVNALSLILMDWEMPIMDGLTCVREIRKLQAQGVVRGHVPVIAVTANVRSEQVEEALKAGMDNVISKPFRIPELCACMQKTMAVAADI